MAFFIILGNVSKLRFKPVIIQVTIHIVILLTMMVITCCIVSERNLEYYNSSPSERDVSLEIVRKLVCKVEAKSDIHTMNIKNLT
jgi:hypothetical protein